MAAVGLTTPTSVLTGLELLKLVSRYVLSGPKGQVEVQIASALIVNKNESLIGQTVLPVNVGNTETPNKNTVICCMKAFVQRTKIYRIKNLHS